MRRVGEPPTASPTDEDSAAWLAALRAEGRDRDEAVSRLHGLLLRAARHELSRRRGAVAHVRGSDLDDIAHQSADDALVAILAKLDEYRGASRFTTWAYKFALLEAGVKLRRRAWQGREVPLEPQRWPPLADGRAGPESSAVTAELLGAIRDGAERELTPHQREVFTALALNGVPIDVLAERLSTSRGALYKALHDARRRLRAHLARLGLAVEQAGEASR